MLFLCASKTLQKLCWDMDQKLWSSWLEEKPHTQFLRQERPIRKKRPKLSHGSRLDYSVFYGILALFFFPALGVCHHIVQLPSLLPQLAEILKNFKTSSFHSFLLPESNEFFLLITQLLSKISDSPQPYSFSRQCRAITLLLERYERMPQAY